MRTADLDYHLPAELIAQRPRDQRDESRMLVLDRATGAMQLDVFRNVASYLREGDCMALNDTRVIRARLHGTKPTGGRVEVFLLRETAPGEWEALVRPSAKVKAGTSVRITESVRAVIGETFPGGTRRVTFRVPDVLGVLEKAGEAPLPPYIHREHPDEADIARYQTIYARHPGAVAAPTAGLHFTEAVLASLGRAGVRCAYLTLHVGYGTFRPIQTERVEDHIVDAEDFVLPDETAHLLDGTRARGGRVVAVGTTCTRVLETRYHEGRFHPGAGRTDLFICPPYRFRAVDALQTNFHLPRSSLLALVCAFAGVELVLDAYRLAIRERFRFYSYGDVMLIL